MNQKTKYLTTFTHGRASKWYMEYGSVSLRFGGVWRQRRNGYKNMILEIINDFHGKKSFVPNSYTILTSTVNEKRFELKNSYNVCVFSYFFLQAHSWTVLSLKNLMTRALFSLSLTLIFQASNQHSRLTIAMPIKK